MIRALTIVGMMAVLSAPLAVGGPVGAPSTSRSLPEMLAARRAPTSGNPWQRMADAEAARANTPDRAYRYSSGIRGTLISWTGHWSTPATTVPDDVTIEPVPDNNYRPPEGVPNIPSEPTWIPPTDPINQTPSPTAVLLGLIGIVTLARSRDLRPRIGGRH